MPARRPAQFDNVRLPEPHLRDLVFDLPTGDYGCDVVQLDDPERDSDEPSVRDLPHLLVRLTAGRQAG